jgi:hypothetical protein
MGVNLEVGDIDEALNFCGGLRKSKLRGENKLAFIDLGDQFTALQIGDASSPRMPIA